MSALVVNVPEKYRELSGCPPGPLAVVSLWEMTEGKVGVWVKPAFTWSAVTPCTAAGNGDRVWPVTGVTLEQVLGWAKETT